MVFRIDYFNLMKYHICLLLDSRYKNKHRIKMILSNIILLNKMKL